jgi:histone H3/H4
MENLTKTSIRRLCDEAGVKKLSNDSYDLIGSLIKEKLNEVINVSLSLSKKKTLIPDDIYKALEILDENIVKSNKLNS